VYAGCKQSRTIAEKLDFYFDIKTQSGINQILIPRFNVLLCSYETLRTDIKQILKIEWQVLAIDEG